MSWTDPSPAGTMDLANGTIVDATDWDNIIADLLVLGGTDGNTKTGSLVIDQAADDGAILTLVSSDLAHGMTAILRTDAYGMMAKNHGTGGGLKVIGATDSDADAFGAIVLMALLGETADTTKSTAGGGVIKLSSYVKNGNTSQAVGADGNLVSIDNGGTTRFIFDAEGSAHGDVEWIAFDDHDDVALLDALDAALTKDPVKTSFGRYLSQFREQLQAAGIVNFYDPEGKRAMVNFTRLAMLLTGAIRQMAQRERALTARLERIEQRLALLPEGGA